MEVVFTALGSILSHDWRMMGHTSLLMFPIYGFGALSVLLSCVPVKESVLLVALVGAVVASFVEYVTGCSIWC